MSASKSKNIADGLCGDFASGSARNPHPSAFDFPSLGGSVLERACAWLGERSEPTCIKTSTRHGAKEHIIVWCFVTYDVLLNDTFQFAKQYKVST